MSFSMISASRLRDGAAVWLSQAGAWRSDVESAALFDTETLPAALAAAGMQPQEVVDVHEVPLAADGQQARVPASLRERIRVAGPTVRADLPRAGWPAADRSRVLPPLPSAHAAPSQAGIYQYDSEDRQVLRERSVLFGEQVARRLSGALSEDEFKPLRLMNGLYLQLHAYMLRVAVPYGVLSSTQMRQLAYVARHYDRGYGHFTTRQNIQFNWITLEDSPAILAALAEADLHAIQTSGNCVRNVTSDEFAGAAADEVLDPRVYAEILRQWSTDHPEFTYLPRKFKIAITGSAHDRTASRLHDIGLLARLDADGAPGFTVYAGGGLGRTPIVATKLRDWLPARDLLRYVEAILRVYNALGRRDNIYKARIKILVREMKPEHFMAMVEDEFSMMPPEYCVLQPDVVAAVAARFAAPAFESSAVAVDFGGEAADFQHWIETNTHAHRQPGYISAMISLKPAGGIQGDASAAEMELVADLADRYSFGELRVTHEQNLVLPHVRQDALRALWAELVQGGLATGNVGLITNIIACPGMDYCSLATARSIAVAQAVAARFADPQRQRAIGPLDLNISGCINACGHHHAGHIGLLGVDKQGEEVYQITLGGAADEHAAIGSIIGPAVPGAQVPDAIEALVDAHLAHRIAGERFIDTYRRLGAAPFKEAVYGAHRLAG